jgi:plastocyanin
MARFACALALAALIASGCGGGDDEEAEPTRAVTVPANASLDVSAKEYSFDPNRVTAEGAGRLTITLTNDGSLAHDIRVRRNGKDVGGTATIPGGETAKATLPLEHGRYELLCSVGDHAELGMRGELTVR